ncbi:MAG: membrane protein [Hyphococcus sp.]|nr:MAG: membrane protein [Marinicaulis sp.]
MFMKRTKIIAALMLATAASIGNAAAEGGPSDMEIAHIAYTAGNLDIRYAHLALAKSDNPDVREFAELMIRDHTSVNDQALALLQKLGATPVDNATSQQLSANAKAKRDELAALDGAAFDRAYAENELGYHQFVNKTVETAFIPAADNKEFKSLLGSALAVFKIHEDHAEMMVKSLR